MHFTDRANRRTTHKMGAFSDMSFSCHNNVFKPQDCARTLWICMLKLSIWVSFGLSSAVAMDLQLHDNDSVPSSSQHCFYPPAPAYHIHARRLISVEWHRDPLEADSITEHQVIFLSTNTKSQRPWRQIHPTTRSMRYKKSSVHHPSTDEGSAC
jgi:hypothetical protein